MARRSYTLAVEPRGVAYRELCTFAEQSGLDVLLVVRDRLVLSPRGHDVLASLERCATSDRRQSEWPGTRLFGHTARVVVVRPDAEPWVVVRGSAEGLFDWQAPDLPEDLCMLRRDGTTFLGNIAHERDAFVELDDDERDALPAAVPLRLE
jgi:hypothetical protein